MKKKPMYLAALLILLFGTMGALHFARTFRAAAPSTDPQVSPHVSSTAEAENSENNELSSVPQLPPLLPAPAHLPPPIMSGASTRYRIVALPKKFVANALNDQTEIAGTWIKGEGRAIPGEPATYWQAAVWKNKTVTRYPNTEDQVECSADAISETSKIGCVGGVTYSEPSIHGRESAFIWKLSAHPVANSIMHQNQTQFVGHLPDKSGVVFAGINRSDQAVGWCGPNDIGEIFDPGPDDAFWDVAGEDLGGQSGFYWDGKQFLELGLGAAAYAINERNQVVGAKNGKIALWQENERKFLGEGRAYSINNRGWTAGEKTMPGKNIMFYNVAPIRHAFVWRGSGKLDDLNCLPGDTNSKARSVNDRGQIVGLSLRVLGEYKTQTRAVLWQAGKSIDLNTLLPHGFQWLLTDARAINNKGQIIVRGKKDYDERSFLLMPR